MESISVIGQDHLGFVANIAELLEKNRVNIEDIQADFYGDMAICNLSTCDDEKTITLLRKHGYRVSTSKQLRFKVTDQSGILAKISRVLTEHAIQIKSINHLHKGSGNAIISMSTSNDELATALVEPFIIA
jgi:predicted amino acid-binding ACT domain protein